MANTEIENFTKKLSWVASELKATPKFILGFVFQASDLMFIKTTEFFSLVPIAMNFHRAVAHVQCCLFELTFLRVEAVETLSNFMVFMPQ